MTQVSIAQALERGLAHHRAGRLAEAQSVYRQILDAFPEHSDALYLLSVIAQQAGRSDEALGLADRAILADARHPGHHYHRGNVLHALGRPDEAIASHQRALQLKPDYAEAHNALAIALIMRGRLDEAAAHGRSAIAAWPGYAGAYVSLGYVLMRQGRYAESIDAYRRALTLRPDLAEAQANLGNVLAVLGRFDDALVCYARALARLETPDIREAFARCLYGAALADNGSGLGPDDLAAIRKFTIRALSEPWARPADLARASMRLILREPVIGECVARASQAWPKRLPGPALFGTSGFTAVASDPLLRALLENAQACELAMERFLTMARHAILEAVELGAGIPEGSRSVGLVHCAAGVNPDALAFLCALARQCHINDYVFATTNAEIERATRLRDQLVAAIARGAGFPEETLATVACYFPLSGVPGMESLLGRSWPEAVAALLAQQVAEPIEEQALREAIPRLTPIGEGTSQRVRQQYEEHPYPRWVSLPPAGPGQTIESHLRGLFPRAPLRPIDEGRGVDVLVAGCGTGQESIETARQFPGARVLAIDLSLASLAYAERKSRELGVSNLEHAQADIVRLDTLDRTFDVIACTGVLHHLSDPLAGWRMLLSRLRPGGLMRVGLYSEQARAIVVAARKFIAEGGHAPTAEGIRRSRDELMSAEGGARFAQLALLRDFYVTGECRDLLFHVEEHRFSLAQIRDMLAALDLRFLGFLLAPGVARAYSERHPEDPAMTDLDAWSVFESEFPRAFAGMYVFWVQRA